jgi:hypothetical protein
VAECDFEILSAQASVVKPVSTNDYCADAEARRRSFSIAAGAAS